MGQKRNSFRCADSQFLLLVDPIRKEKTDWVNGKQKKCPGKPGKPENLHNHEMVSQEMLEFAVIRWECVLRILSHRHQETSGQSIECVLSLWPHQLTFPSNFLKSKLYPFLNFYRGKATNHEFVQTFLDQFGEDRVALFRQVVLQFKSAPALPGQFFFIFCSSLSFKI